MSKSGTRAPNGMGSIRQRTDGRWEGRYTGPDGKQHSVFAKSHKEVGARLREATHSVDVGSWLDPANITVMEWLKTWLDDYQADTTPNTVSKYRCIFDKHFTPVVGRVKLASLGDIHIQHLLSALKKSDLAASTIKNYMGIFSTALNQARKAKLIRENPAIDLDLSGAPKKEFHIIDRKQLPDFFAAAKATKYPAELSFGILTGLRVGELRGLRWIDVDLDAGTINVRQQLKPKRKDQPRFTLPKYAKTRLIHLPAEAVTLLKQQRKRQAEQRLAAGTSWQEDGLGAGLVFRQLNGKAHGEHTIAAAVAVAGEAIGIPELHPHDLRHSYAVALLRSGADVKTVQHNLGHATVKMTLDVYAAYTQDAGQQSAEKLSAYLQGMNI